MRGLIGDHVSPGLLMQRSPGHKSLNGDALSPGRGRRGSPTSFRRRKAPPSSIVQRPDSRPYKQVTGAQFYLSLSSLPRDGMIGPMDASPLISASILSAEFGRLGEDVLAAQAAGVDWIHIDVMDGHFVPNITMGPLAVRACRRVTDLPLDVHLMIEEPERYVRDFAEAGADSLTVHLEACTHLHRTLQSIRESGCRAGLALNPGTAAATVEPVLDLIDMVLVMTVNPGFSGQEFLSSMLPKVRQVRQTLDARVSKAHLQVDGGISADTAPSVIEAGATVLAAASSIFRHPKGIEAGVRTLRESTQPSPA